MVNRVENINSNILLWAISRAGYELHEFLDKFPKVQEWIEGEKNPTVKQLEDFTKRVHVPFGYLFLKEPPKEELEIPFFRTGRQEVEEVSLNIFHTVQMLQDRQAWLKEYLENNEYSDLEFVGKFTVQDDYQVIVDDIRRTLNLEENWASKHRNWQETLNHLTAKIEEIGIIVTFNGVVGNNTRRKIEVEECRGFVLVDKKVPFLFLNSADAKAAQMFTIIHELAHIWLGESAGFDNSQLLPADDPVEILCDKIAAEFLVPKDYFIDQWNINSDYKSLSRHFKVSPIVIARRALDLNLITKASFFEFYNNYIREFYAKKESQGSGGDFYATAKKRLSPRFANYVNKAVKENSLLYRDAYKLTNLRGNTYDKFMNEHLYQV